VETKKVLMTEPKTRQKLRFLHVEDDDGDAKLLERALNKYLAGEDYFIQRAKSLRDAMSDLQREAYDAVLLDLGLEDSVGLDAFNAIKEISPDLPIVIFSAQLDDGIALDAVRGGAQEFVAKGEGSSRMLALSVLCSIERKRYERHLFKLANHDALTGLPNRRMFQEHIKHWLTRAERWQRAEAIMFMDVDGFKKVNDTLGHDVGDELLSQIAARLTLGLRASDMLARYAGDEFIVHLDMGATVSEDICAQVAKKIVGLFADPICIGGHEIHTGVSIGIAFFPKNGNDTTKLFRKADEAMYRAKRLKEKFAFAI
jgi:diguanylate cyclase (GGDEF)-like protein